jgi:enoyl-CoA hydratase/carnithine racemase
MASPILVERDGPVLVVAFNRPEVANAADAETARLMDEALSAAEADREIGAIIITGAGNRVFCSGMDLKEAAAKGVGLGLIPERGFCGITERSFKKPVIAAVNGAAVAGGFEIALACDVVIASEHAVFGLPEVKRGLAAYAGGVQRLARQLPRSAAMEIILSGEAIPAHRLHALGIVSRIVPAQELRAAALGFAQAILANSWHALAWSKALYSASVDVSLAEGFARGRALAAAGLGGGDSEEGVRAFAGHRAAEFKNG